MKNRFGLRSMAVLALAPGVLVPVACVPSLESPQASPLVGSWSNVAWLPQNGWFSEGDPQRLLKIASLAGPVNNPAGQTFSIVLTLKRDGTFEQDLKSSNVGIHSVGRYSVAGNRFQMTCTDLQVNGKSVKAKLTPELTSPFSPTGTFKQDNKNRLTLTMNGSDLMLLMGSNGS